MNDAPRSATIAALTWGVKQSFRNYVQATGGTIEVAAGAALADDGTFAFPALPGEALSLDAQGRPTGAGRFAGEVRFQAHGGMLSVRLAEPGLEIGPAGAALTVAEGDRRVAIASLDLAAAAPDAAGDLVLPAALTLDGSFLLGDHYPPSTVLDAVRLTLAR